MKSWTQTVVVLGVFVILVGGLTFVYQSLNIQPDSTGGTAADDNAGQRDAEDQGLYFPVTKEEFNTVVEKDKPGHQDYWFENRSPEPVDVGLNSKSCKCANVELLTLTADERPSFKFPPEAVDKKNLAGRLDQHEGWQPLEDQHIATVPAQAAGVVRLGWKAKNVGPERISAKLWTKPKAGRAAYTDLEVRVNIVPPVLVQPQEQTVPDVMPGRPQSVELLCWSATRDGFKLDVKELNGDQNFVCQRQPLSKADRKKLADAQKMPVKCGYLVKVTVYEQRKDRHLDLGAFQRNIVLGNDLGYDLSVELKGTVGGEIQIGTPEDHGRIDLGSFPAEVGARRTVWLESGRPGLELEVERAEPSYLEVQQLKAGKVLPDGGKRWQLTVAAPRGLLGGRLPQHSAVILKTNDKEPRRIHIPVVGRAYRGQGR